MWTLNLHCLLEMHLKDSAEEKKDSNCHDWFFRVKLLRVLYNPDLIYRLYVAQIRFIAAPMVQHAVVVNV